MRYGAFLTPEAFLEHLQRKKAEQSDVTRLDFEKANASTLGGYANAINALQEGKADADDIPQPGNATPMAEAVAGASGALPPYSRMDHQHPRMSSTTYVTLAANGQATATFTRTFTSKPGLMLTEVDAAAGSQALVIRGLAWQTNAQGQYTGVTIQGLRAQTLPTLTSVSGILTAVITGINGIVTALSNFNIFGGSAAGASVSVIALARSG